MGQKVSALNSAMANLAGEGLARVEIDGVPEGYGVVKKGDTFYGVSYDGWRSGPMQKIEQATSWIRHRALASSGNAPRYGELWAYADRTVIICGNSVDPGKTIWVMDWISGERLDASLDKLEIRPDRHSLTEAAIVERFSKWAEGGNQHAMWWLAWW